MLHYPWRVLATGRRARSHTGPRRAANEIHIGQGQSHDPSEKHRKKGISAIAHEGQSTSKKEENRNETGWKAVPTPQPGP